MEKLESEFREFEAITGKTPDEHATTLALKRLLPKNIRSMLQTVDVHGYKLSKEYALKRARDVRNERVGDTPGGEATKTETLDRLDHLYGQEEEELDEEALALQRKGKGKGYKGYCFNC